MTIPQYAAKLWADQIRSSVQDAGDDNINMLLMFSKGNVPRPSNEELDLFKDIMSRRIEIGITGKHKKYSMNVDYDPDIELCEVCEAAGINPVLLPVKSYMEVYPDSIRYKFGYGQPIQTITLEEIHKL